MPSLHHSTVLQVGTTVRQANKLNCTLTRTCHRIGEGNQRTLQDNLINSISKVNFTLIAH